MGIALLLIFGGRTLQNMQSAPEPAGVRPAPVASRPAGGARLASALAPEPAAGVLQVYKSPTCGCCGEWIEHLEAEGFQVEVVDRPDMMAVKAELGLPGEMASCHTGIIDGYLVEGHVPADDIQRLLAERPDVKGIAVPGMPVGSPGMEIEGQPADPYDVLVFDDRGRTEVYASY